MDYSFNRVYAWVDLACYNLVLVIGFFGDVCPAILDHVAYNLVGVVTYNRDVKLHGALTGKVEPKEVQD